MTELTKTTRVLRMKDLPVKVGLQPSTIYGLVARGDFPPPFKFIYKARKGLLNVAMWIHNSLLDIGFFLPISFPNLLVL